MNANRPRPSVLSLFDPLSVETPDADKENHPSPSVFLTQPVVLPKKRLVDVGDTTLAEDVSAPEEQKVLQQEVDTNGVQQCLDAPQPRTPLTEITLGDMDATPLTQGKTYLQPSTPPLPSSLITLVPDVGNPSCHDTVSRTDDMNSGDFQVPQIVISHNSVDNSPERFSQLTSHDNTTTSSIVSYEERTVHPNLHLCAPITTSQDCNRFSLDLQASFQMYLQSEASFDLLNDKISLIEPMEPQTTDDERFDFELDKDILKDAIAKLKRGRKSDASPSSPTQDSSESNFSYPKVHDEIPDQKPDDNVLDSPTSPSNDFQLAQHILSSPLSGSSDKSGKRWSTSSGIPSPTSCRGPKVPSPTPAKAVPSAIPQSKQRRFSIPVATPLRLPAIIPPPAIQALRIVKRTKMSSAKAEPLSDASVRETESLPSSLATGPAPRNPTNTFSESRSLRTQPPSSSKPAKAAPSTGTGLGPRRMTATTESQVGATVARSSQTTLGPKRILIGNDEPNPTLSKPSPISSGLKQPRRIEPGTSNLPRPSGMAAGTSTSRLPTLINGLQSRLRRPGSGTSKGEISRRTLSGD